MLINALGLGLIAAASGISVYFAIWYRGNQIALKHLAAEKERYAALRDDVQLLKHTYQTGDLTEKQRAQVRELYNKAVKDLKEQAGVVASLNQEV